MNQTQRKFLIDKIGEKTNERIKALYESKQQYPSASNYLFKAILSGTLELQPDAVTLKALEDKARKAKEGYNWLSEDHMGWDKETTVKIKLEHLFVLPEDFYNEQERVREHNEGITKQIAELRIALDTLEVRIQLASDKTLAGMVSEVDDMGDIKLIDSSLKLLK